MELKGKLGQSSVDGLLNVNPLPLPDIIEVDSLKVGSHDPISIQLTLKIFECVMEFVGVHTIQLLHPIISRRAHKALTILVLRISCLLHRS